MNHLLPLAQDAGISNRELRDTLLPVLDALGIVQVERDSADRVRFVRPLVIDEDDVVSQAARVWRHLDPQPSERGALHILRDVASLPRTEEEIVRSCAEIGLTEDEAALALELAETRALVLRRHVSDFDCDFLYNDFLWGEDIDRTAKALSALPRDVRENLRSLLDELHQNEGRPLKDIESAPKGLVELAVREGIIERTEIVTESGKRGSFHFTPRFQGFGVAREDVPDVLDQVRLVIASFAFATHYARYKLDNPERFLEVLIDSGHAGNASPIATDYGALEKQKIVSVEPVAEGSKRFRFTAVKKDALLTALDTMRAGSILRQSAGSSSGNGLLQPREFSDPVATRLRLGQEAADARLHQDRLLAAVRDAAQQDKFL
ncbi:MAG TPA: hypothetical protein VGG40_12570 [Solirubrobacterales bacterium]